jgi:hypothetical protein
VGSWQHVGGRPKVKWLVRGAQHDAGDGPTCELALTWKRRRDEHCPKNTYNLFSRLSTIPCAEYLRYVLSTSTPVPSTKSKRTVSRTLRLFIPPTWKTDCTESGALLTVLIKIHFPCATQRTLFCNQQSGYVRSRDQRPRKHSYTPIIHHQERAAARWASRQRQGH